MELPVYQPHVDIVTDMAEERPSWDWRPVRGPRVHTQRRGPRAGGRRYSSSPYVKPIGGSFVRMKRISIP